ncbi:MAG: HNH endonuclease [Lachnospiraceae bacterium]|nr:HNH endonuclease [Lachnospiraceae bacterium]
MISKSTKRKIVKVWHDECAICGSRDFLEFHHIIPKSSGGSDDYDNIILLCACCHSGIHERAYNAQKYHKRTSIEYELAIPILKAYFAKEMGAKEAKEKLNLSSKTHLSESSVYKRYKREHNIGKFYNNVDLVNSKRRTQNV